MASVSKYGDACFLYTFLLIHCMMLFQLPSMNCQTSEREPDFPTEMWPFCLDSEPYFRTSQTIKITGFVERYGTIRTKPWLEINLRPSCYSGNSPFYLKIRFDNRKVIRTSIQDGNWATEESDGPFPFIQGAKFLLSIELLETEYKVTANGVLLGTYKDRCSACPPPKSLKVNGASASIQRVELIDKTEEGQPARSKIIYPVPLGPEIVHHPSFPFYGYFPGNLQAGKAIHIIGYFPKNEDRTTIDLLTACSGCRIMLHLDVRFTHIDRNKVVRTIYDNGWGHGEDRSGPFPFRSREPFHITIAVQPDSYNIEVNDTHCWTYKHRLPFTEVDAMTIQRGHMSIWSVQYTDIEDESTAQMSTAPVEVVAPVEVTAAAASNDSGIYRASACMVLFISLISFLQQM